MRKAALSFSLLLALLMSLLVAAPAQAAGSPSPPTNVVATDDGCTDTVTLSWTASTQAVAGYRIHIYGIEQIYEGGEYYGNERYTLASLDVAGRTSAVVKIPRYDRELHIEVAAVTNMSAPFTGGANGESLQSSSTQSISATTKLYHFGAVPAPINVTAAADTDTGLTTLRWEAPSLAGQPCDFQSYRSYVRDTYVSDDDYGSDPDVDWLEPTTSSKTVQLETNHRYEFCIWASSPFEGYYGDEYTEYASSPESCVLFGTGRAIPSEPGDVWSETVGTSITVGWRSPYTDGGSDITGYRVARTGVDASGNGPWSTTVSADKRSQTFTNLRSNTNYTFTVQAINAIGVGPFLSVEGVSNPYSPPSTPTSVGGTVNNTARTATIGWMPPTSPGNPAITGYRVSRSGVDNAGSGPWSTVVASSARSYTFTNLAAGGTYTLSVTAINAGGESSPTSTVVALSGSALTAPTPTISGTATVGSTLTANAGTWGPAPVALAYQWRANGTAISGATAGTYRLAATEAGKTITVAVTGSKSGYVSTTRVSTATAAVSGGALTAATPTVTGTAKVGSTLTANPGTWGPAPVSFSYQWKADGVALSGATASTYTPSSATLGKKISVTVSGGKTGYTGASRTSVATAAVVAGTFAAVTPTITGTAKVGSTLTAVPGEWGPAPVAFTYQWKANGTALSGATGSTYRPSAATLGKTITVTVSGTKAGYTSATRTSAATAAVASGTLTAVTPKITGTAKVGSTLTATAGTWGPAPVALTYQWKANGTAISGATATTYKPTSATVGKTITVTVTGKKTAYTTATRTSTATAAVVR